MLDLFIIYFIATAIIAFAKFCSIVVSDSLSSTTQSQGQNKKQASRTRVRSRVRLCRCRRRFFTCLGRSDTLKKMDAVQSSLSADSMHFADELQHLTHMAQLDCSCSNLNLRSLISPSCPHELDNVGNGNTVREVPWSRRHL
jgi:hypothetical protein